MEKKNSRIGIIRWVKESIGWWDDELCRSFLCFVSCNWLMFLWLQFSLTWIFVAGDRKDKRYTFHPIKAVDQEISGELMIIAWRCVFVRHFYLLSLFDIPTFVNMGIDHHHHRDIFISITLSLLMILTLMQDMGSNRTTVLVDSHHHHLYRLLKRTHFIPIPIIIPVHHKHQWVFNHLNYSFKSVCIHKLLFVF